VYPNSTEAGVSEFNCGGELIPSYEARSLTLPTDEG
jgi:hypothetical protein